MFKFTAAEWSASVFILCLMISTFIFKYLYNKNGNNSFSYENYKYEIEQFYEQINKMENKRDSTHFYKIDSIKKRINSRISDGYAIEKIEINSCDSLEIERIPLFGKKRAEKLIEYRDKLGGFVSLTQLQEVFILQSIDTTYLEKYFYIGKENISKIKINEANYETMIKHPYLDSYLVKTIIYYRTKENGIKNMEELKRYTKIYNELAKKLEPYIEF